MSNGFYYKKDSTNISDLVDLSAMCTSAHIDDNYLVSLAEQGYCSDDLDGVYLVKYSTSALGGLWANRRAAYCNAYMVNNKPPMDIAARGCAPIPRRSEHDKELFASYIYDIAFSCRLIYLTADDINAKNGSGIYMVRANFYTFITDKTHIVLDIVGAGGGGSGGNKGTNVGGHSRGGSGGGSGAWASYLIDMTKHGDFSITIGEPGRGGGCEEDGTDGGASYLAINTACSEGIVDTLNGGGGAQRSYYVDIFTGGVVGNVGYGGYCNCNPGLSYTDSELVKYGVYRLASGHGVAGGEGGSVNNAHGAGEQGSNGPDKVAFGNLATFNNSDFYGGSAVQNPSFNYSDLDERYAVGGGGGGSLFASGGRGEGAWYGDTIYTGDGWPDTSRGEFGTKGSGGGGGYGGKKDSTSVHIGGDGGRGHARIYYEDGTNGRAAEEVLRTIQNEEYTERTSWSVRESILPASANIRFYSSISGGDYEEFDEMSIYVESDMLKIRYRYYFADEMQPKEYVYAYEDGWNDDSLKSIDVETATKVSSSFYTAFNSIFTLKSSIGGGSTGGNTGGNSGGGTSGGGNEEIPLS